MLSVAYLWHSEVLKLLFLFQDHLLQWMHISISEPEKRTGNSSVKQDTYVVYLIETK